MKYISLKGPARKQKIEKTTNISTYSCHLYFHLVFYIQTVLALKLSILNWTFLLNRSIILRTSSSLRSRISIVIILQDSKQEFKINNFNLIVCFFNGEKDFCRVHWDKRKTRFLIVTWRKQTNTCIRSSQSFEVFKEFQQFLFLLCLHSQRLLIAWMIGWSTNPIAMNPTVAPTIGHPSSKGVIAVKTQNRRGMIQAITRVTFPRGIRYGRGMWGFLSWNTKSEIHQFILFICTSQYFKTTKKELK